MKSCPWGEPSTRGMPSDSMESVKISSAALSRAGRSMGTVIRPSTLSGGAPALRAAFSSEESVPERAAWQTRKTTGTATAVPSTAMPGTLVRFSGTCRV